MERYSKGAVQEKKPAAMAGFDALPFPLVARGLNRIKKDVRSFARV